MYYFRFEIPKQDGDKTVAYSPSWHRTMPKCPFSTTVLLYNDKEGFGIAKTNDTFIPPEVDVITAKDATDELALCPSKNDVIKSKSDYLTDLTRDGIPKEIWYGAKLAKRWDKINTPMGVSRG